MNEETKYLESIVKPLLAYPDDIKIEHSVDEKGVLLQLSANKVDMGRIIGKAGITANSIRTLVKQYGVLREKHVSVKINEAN